MWSHASCMWRSGWSEEEFSTWYNMSRAGVWNIASIVPGPPIHCSTDHTFFSDGDKLHCSTDLHFRERLPRSVAAYCLLHMHVLHYIRVWWKQHQESFDDLCMNTKRSSSQPVASWLFYGTSALIQTCFTPAARLATSATLSSGRRGGTATA